MFFKPGEDIPLYGNLSTQFDHLDKLSEIKPLVPKSIETISDFKLSSEMNLGPGIAKESFGFKERYRAGKHEKFGEDHINLEYISPIINPINLKSLKPWINIHINMKDE